jgi:sialidase-1
VPYQCAIGVQGPFWALYDTDAQHGPPQWRCYASETLNPSHTKYENGTAYCTRDAQLLEVLNNCAAGVVTPVEPVFMHGARSSNLNVSYPCIRIPSIVSLETTPPSLAAFAECRYWVGDNCFPVGVNGTKEDIRDLCMRTSVDGGVTWTPLVTVVQCGSQPGPVVYWSAEGPKLNMQFNRCSVQNFSNAQIVGDITGPGEIAWGAVESTTSELGPADGSWVGPGISIRLRSTNPVAPGRLVTIAHTSDDFVWYSDDDGASWTVANTSTLRGVNEAQIAERADGTLLASLRSDAQPACQCTAFASSADGGASWSPIFYNPALPNPLCQASLLRDNVSDALYFSNPANTSDRATGTVRLSADSAVSWTPGFRVTQFDFAYSCLVDLNATALGLLWEGGTASNDCVGSSCAIYYSLLPKAVLQP